MKWSVSVRSIAAAAMGKGQQVTAIKATPGETLEAEEQQASALPTGLVDHTFKLRADFDVVIRLPQDFTAHEADRLGKFLQALPLS